MSVTFIADNNSSCRSLVSQNVPIGRVLGGWVWLTSITLAVIGRLSVNVGLLFSEMAASNVAVFCIGDICQ